MQKLIIERFNTWIDSNSSRNWELSQTGLDFYRKKEKNITSMLLQTVPITENGWKPINSFDKCKILRPDKDTTIKERL